MKMKSTHSPPFLSLASGLSTIVRWQQVPLLLQLRSSEMSFASQVHALLILCALPGKIVFFFKSWVRVRLALGQMGRSTLGRCKALPYHNFHGADASYNPGLASNLIAQTRWGKRAWPTPAATLPCLADVGEAWEEERHRIARHPFHDEMGLRDPMSNEAVTNASCIWGHRNENCTEH